MTHCPVCGQLHAPNCLRAALEDLRSRPVGFPVVPRCPFCTYPRADGIQTHAPDCEWCTLVQHVASLEGKIDRFYLALEEIAQAVTGNPNTIVLKEPNGTNEAIPDTQRSGEPRHPCPGCGRILTFIALCCFCEQALDPGEPHADSGAAEPGRSAPSGADAAPAGPERTD